MLCFILAFSILIIHLRGHEFKMNQGQVGFLFQLLREIDSCFNLGELRELCFLLNIEYEHLPGDERLSKIRSLLLYQAKAGPEELGRLLAQLRALRPNSVWPDIPELALLKQEIDSMDESSPRIVWGDISVGNVSRMAIGHGAQVHINYVGERRTELPTKEQLKAHLRALTQQSEYLRWNDESVEDHYIHEKSKVLPLFASPYEDLGSEASDLINTMKENNRLVILGEPGMGKTTAMQRMVWEIAHRGNIVPVFVRLLSFRGDLLESIRVTLNKTKILHFDNIHAVRYFLYEQPCLFLFDGLNEVPGDQRNIVGKIDNFINDFPDHQYIITSRMHDKIWKELHSSEIIEKAVVIQRITNQQVRAYLIAHLADEGSDLFDQMSKQMKKLSHVPLFLWMMKEVGIVNGIIPKTQGELFESFVNQSLSRDNKLEIRIRSSVKRTALINLAFNFQLVHRLSCTYKDARDWLEPNLLEQTDLVLEELLMHGLLKGEDEQLRFLQQSIQEYFAAIRLNQKLNEHRLNEQVWLKWLNRITKLLIYFLIINLLLTVIIFGFLKNPELLNNVFQLIFSSTFLLVLIWLVNKYIFFRFTFRQYAKWLSDDWWVECFLLLAGLTEQNNWLVYRILETKPWIALWCMAEGKPVDNKLQSLVQDKTFNKLLFGSVEQRLNALEDLARIINDRSIPYLIMALEDENEQVVDFGVQLLTRVGEPSINFLIPELDSRFERTRLAVIRALGGVWRLPFLVALGDRDRSRRLNAISRLGDLQDERTVQPLVAGLKDKDPYIRKETLKTLRMIGDPRSIRPIIHMLNDSNHNVRVEAATVLRGFGVQTIGLLLTAFKETNGTVQREVVKLLGDFRDPLALDSLIAALGNGDFEVRMRVASSLGKMGEVALEPLLATLSDTNKDWAVRGDAAKALGELGDERAVGLLLNAFEDENVYIRRMVAEALGKLGDISVLEPLIIALEDEDWLIREAVAKALQRLGEAAIEPLTKRLMDKRWVIRGESAKILGGLGDDRVLEPLLVALKDENSYVRSAAALGLGKLGNNQALESLLASFSDENIFVRVAATEALGELGDTRALELLVDSVKDESASVRRAVAEALGKLGTYQAIEPLNIALNDEDEEVRVSAKNALLVLKN